MIEMNLNFNTKLSFENGLTVSFSIGEGNYCANKNFTDNPYSNQKSGRTCKNCEVLVFETSTGNGLKIQQFLPKGKNDDGTYVGWIIPNELAQIINNVANWKG